MPFTPLLPMVAAAALVALSSPASSASTKSTPTLAGVWTNPSGSVSVRVAPCQSNRRNFCGAVIRASAKARSDAAKGGTPNLVGTQIFRDFEPIGDSRWRGEVFVPDIAHTFRGEIVLAGDRIEARGCLVEHIACKEQNWRRGG
jgi:uncharacterized protein (DUF2147 family)